ncbi:MAG: polysaccharide pyruvyl transferase family protein [Candidatus Helarchaeota archaeon]|nr:polysaccharide pyruvyl transferase family protein [Candidatus Helarchaeota archaeon]
MDSFIDLINNFEDKKLCFVDPSGGNHGDYLIKLGLFKKLDELNVSYDIDIRDSRSFLSLRYFRKYKLPVIRYFWKHKKVDYSNYDLVILRGGGYLNDIWYGVLFLLELLKNSRNVVVAPQSCWFRSMMLGEQLKGIKIPLTIFTREKYSYEYLRGANLPKKVKVELAPDSALYLNTSDLIEFTNPYPQKPLFCFRKDLESKISPTELETLIKKYPEAQIEDIAINGTFNNFMSRIWSASIIYTDRLHVAIAGLILGKKVVLYSNSYWKNKGVYEYNLKKYDNIKFIDI